MGGGTKQLYSGKSWILQTQFGVWCTNTSQRQRSFSTHGLKMDLHNTSFLFFLPIQCGVRVFCLSPSSLCSLQVWGSAASLMTPGGSAPWRTKSRCSQSIQTACFNATQWSECVLCCYIVCAGRVFYSNAVCQPCAQLMFLFADTMSRFITV